jgi:hypothetical protein
VKAKNANWGRFWLARTNPNTSTSGLYSTVAAYYAAKSQAKPKKFPQLTLQDLSDSGIRTFIDGVESSVLFYAESSLSMLSQLYTPTRTDTLEMVSAITVAESSVVNYNLGYPTGEAGGKKGDEPRVKLVALYPREGLLFADQVYMIPTWVREEKRKAAEKLLAFLLSDKAQKRFRHHGFREPEGEPAQLLKGAPWILEDAGLVRELRPPPPQVVLAIRDDWVERRKRARVLVITDLSASPPSPVERVHKAVEETVQRHFHPHDEVSVSALPSGAPTYASLQEAIARFGDTNRINGIIFITDGRREEDPNALLDLLDAVEAARRDLGVRVFPIGVVKKKAECGDLKSLANHSRTKAECPVGADEFERVFAEVVENF